MDFRLNEAIIVMNAWIFIFRNNDTQNHKNYYASGK